MRKEIKGYEGLYEIDEDGTVYTKTRKGTNKNVIRSHDDCHGYLTVQLFKNGVGTRFKIHRLLAETFINNPENKPTVDHIDRDRRNNRLSNLRWATYKEQRENQKSGEKRVIAVKENKKHIFESISECARFINSSPGNVCNVCKGKRKTANGWKIEYEV